MSFNDMATKINLDTGIIKTLDLNKFKNVLVLAGTYYSLKAFNNVIKGLIKTKFHLYANITANPTDAVIYSISNFARDKDIDCILSVGSNAVIESGKLVNLLLSHGGLLHEYLPGGTIGPLGITPNVIYHIAVPTISGGGAEISGSASFIMNKEKMVITTPYLMPKAAFIDPGLMTNIPDKLWAGIGFECFATALAAYVSTYANPTSDAFAEEALRGYIKFSPLLMKDTDNVEYIKQMEVSSINAFVAASFSSTGAAHAIADVLSAKFNIQIGLSLAMVCGEIAAQNYDFNKEKFDKVIEMFKSSKKTTKKDDIKTVINNLISKLGITLPSLKDKIEKTEIESLANSCINYAMRGNPKMLTPVEVEAILKKLL